MPYTPTQAARLAGLSISGIKNYATRWAQHFSPSANPGRGVPRQYTDSDIRKLRMIGQLAKSGTPTNEIAGRLEAGEMADWQPTDTPQEATAGPQQTTQPTAALVLVQQAMTALQDVLEAERSERQELQRRLEEAQARAERAEAQLQEARKPWYRRLFSR